MNITAKLQLNSTQIPNFILDELMPILGETEFKIIMTIARQTYGWHKESDQISYSQLKLKTGKANGSIGTALKSLREKGLIEVLDASGHSLKSKEECLGKELFYRISTSPKTGDHLSKNWSSKTGDTKETNTKTLLRNGGVVKKQPSCPLLSVDELKKAYPTGHTECVEYLQSVEEMKGAKFINRGKQFKVLHNILKAGYDFNDIDRIAVAIEKKYGQGQWDFSTVSNWLEKGIKYAKA